MKTSKRTFKISVSGQLHRFSSSSLNMARISCVEYEKFVLAYRVKLRFLPSFHGRELRSGRVGELSLARLRSFRGISCGFQQAVGPATCFRSAKRQCTVNPELVRLSLGIAQGYF